MGEMLICNRRDNDTLVDPLGTIRTLQTGDSSRPLALGSLPSKLEIESSQSVLQTWEIQGKLRYIK